MKDHLTVKVPYETWYSEVTVPQKDFPKSFLIENKDFICGGYFLGYEKDLSPQDIFNFCLKNEWRFLANLPADFIIFFIDNLKHHLFVLVSQTGFFPCYFSWLEKEFVFSTSFAKVKEKLSKKTLNLNSAFDYLRFSYCNLPQDFTILNEIGELPPATLLEIDNGFNYRLSSLLNFKDFFTEDIKPFETVKEFNQELLCVLQKIISERKLSSRDLPKAAELSSGYDSSLIAYILSLVGTDNISFYSWFSKEDLDDSDPELVKKFSQKHNVKVSFWDKSEFYPFNSLSDLSWTKENFYPALFAQNLSLQFYEFLAKKGKQILFVGEGGDELYGMKDFEKTYRFLPHLDFFDTIAADKWDIDKIFTKKGLDFLYDMSRFSKRNFYLSIISTSVLAERLYFPIFWEKNLWPIMPLADLRVLKLARKVPVLVTEKHLAKPQIWAERTDIFLIEQLQPKYRYGTRDFVKKFVKEKKDFLIKTLDNSLLGEKGLLKSAEIVANLKQDKIDLYSDKNMLVFHNLVRLEYFLQENNVSV